MTMAETAQEHFDLFERHFIDHESNRFILITDIHGQYEKLKSLWSNLQSELGAEVIHDEYIVVFLGDYVDKGPQSKECLDFLIELKAKRRPNTTFFILGNHDLGFGMFLKLWPADKGMCFSETWKGKEDQYPRLWSGDDNEHLDMHLQGRKYGHHSLKGYSSKTLDSYGATDYPSLVKLVPQEHKDFIRTMPLALHSQQYIFVHAGLLHEENVDQQLAKLFKKDMFESMPQQLYHKELTCLKGHPDTHKCIVSGHVEQEQVQMSDKRILLDTTGGKVGHLSAVVLPEKKVVTSQIK